MEPPLTGLGLFTRPATAASPHPMSIAVDLGLDPAAPRADRPWACRVTTPLLKPGPDGLAHNVAEIERLAVLGQALVKHVAAGAGLAAVVTTAGARTWLLHAARGDLSVDAAFAGQTDYVPTTTIASDPDWAGYRSLYPTPAEAAAVMRRRAESDAVATARAATQATVRSLRAAGVDLSRPSPVRYAVSFPPGTDAEPFARAAVAAGLRADGGAFVRDDLPDLALILRTERWLIREAARAGGRYDGWSAAA